MRRFAMAALGGVLAVATIMPIGPVAAAPPSKAQCEKAWYEWQYFSLAPGFPVTLTPKERTRQVQECRKAGRLPDYNAQVRLTQKAFNTTAQILERQIRRVSIEKKLPPCLAIEEVLKPVGPNGKPLGPRDNVEGYAADSFLPITKYNWYGGPFRLKFGVGCDEPPYANLWFLADPYPPDPDIEHPDRYPSDAEVKKDPWPRTPVEGAMSTCISWGPGLKNDSVGGEGFIFAFKWNRTNLPNDVRSCYPRALGQEGLDRYPFKVVPNLPL